MKPFLFLFLFLFLPFCSFGQIIEIFVSDADTNTPLPFANIYFVKSGVGASTNRAGVASFKESGLLGQDSVVISYIGYRQEVFFFSKNLNKETFDIKLLPASQLLEEVVVRYEKPPPPEKVIKTAIKNTSRNYSTQDVVYQSIYREKINENGNFIQLNEAILKTYYTGYPKKKLNRKIWKDWNYDESYAFELEGDLFFYPLLKDFNTREDHQTIVATRHSENWSKYGMETTLIGDPLLLFSFDKIKYQYDFFNPSVLKKYQFKHEEEEVVDGEKCFVLSFYPEATDRKFKIDQARKNKSAIYIGRLYITKESFALVKFQYKLAVERDFGFFAKRMPLDYQVEVNYKKYNDFYGIENVRFWETNKVGTKENGESILHQASKELYVINVQNENVKPFADSIRFKSTRFSSIRHYTKKYDPEYWNEINLDDSIALSPKLISDLEVNRSLSKQFDKFKRTNKEDLIPPVPFKEDYTFDYHGQEVMDSLHWMALSSNEYKLQTYLREENKYAKNELVEDRKYQKKLFTQLNKFYRKDTSQARVVEPGKFFFEEDSLGNDICYYQRSLIEREEVFNLTLFEDSHGDVFITRLIPNPSKQLLIIKYEKVGVLGDLVAIVPFGGRPQLELISNVYSIEWYSDSTFLYAKTDKIGRAGKLILRDISNKRDTIVYEEEDLKFDIEIIRENDHLFCTIQSKTENEIYLVNQNLKKPLLKLIKKRKEGVVNEIKVADGFYILVNDESQGSYIEYTTLEDPGTLRLFANSNKKDYILDILPLKSRLIALVYENSIPQLKYLNKGEQKWQKLKSELGVGDYRFITAINEDDFIFSFSSLSSPYKRFQYDFSASEFMEVSKVDVVKPQFYKYTSTKRVWVRSHDGFKIPVTLIKNRASAKENSGLILKTYGAYGAITTPSFDAQDAILLDHGYTIAYAHVRGESILGTKWYQSGRKLLKENSILDYLSCAEYLIKKGITSPDQLIGYGNSAGGLVVAQAINLRPELFNTIILDHAYLDVVNTMMNDTLPLTIDEYKEWGNPKNREVYDYLLSYSPYQNIKAQKYPNVLLIASYHDYQTPIWQIAKYTAKLRANNLSDNKVVLLTDMNSGHLGNTLGKQWIKLFAETYSFVKLNN